MGYITTKAGQVPPLRVTKRSKKSPFHSRVYTSFVVSSCGRWGLVEAQSKVRTAQGRKWASPTISG